MRAHSAHRGSTWRRRTSAAVRRTRAGRTLSQAREARSPLGYLGAALRASGAPRAHGLRGGGTVLLRHGTVDVVTFDEVFCAHVYEPPEPVEAVLAALGRPPRVADLGANVGVFAAWASQRWPGAAITAVEPDPANVEVLERCAAANAPTGRWDVVVAAAGAREGTARFAGGLGAESHLAAAGEQGTMVPVVDAFDVLAEADLLKLDVEGGEWEILADRRLAGTALRAVVLEHHGRHCPTRTPRRTATDLLERAGFTVRAVGAGEPAVGLLWAWRDRVARPARGMLEA